MLLCGDSEHYTLSFSMKEMIGSGITTNGEAQPRGIDLQGSSGAGTAASHMMMKSLPSQLASKCHSLIHPPPVLHESVQTHRKRNHPEANEEGTLTPHCLGKTEALWGDNLHRQRRKHCWEAASVPRGFSLGGPSDPFEWVFNMALE